MKIIQFLFSLIFLISMISREQPTGNINIYITGIEHENGTLYIALFSENDKFLEEASIEKKIPVEKQKKFEVTFENIPCGTYAVSVYHDLDDNGKLDSNFIGIPKEPVGFSNDHQPKMGPPKFDGAKFSLQQDKLDLTINMYTY